MTPAEVAAALADVREQIRVASLTDAARRTRCDVCQAMTPDLHRHHRLHDTPCDCPED